MSYQSCAGEVIDAEHVEVISAQRGMGTSLLSRHSRATMSRIVEEASTLSVYDRCRASLTKDGDDSRRHALSCGATTQHQRPAGRGVLPRVRGCLCPRRTGHDQEVVEMEPIYIALTVVITTIVVGGIITLLYELEIKYLDRDNRMLQAASPRTGR